MTKEQYIRVIERVINSPRNDYQKIIMLQQGFELYVAEHEEQPKNNKDGDLIHEG